MNTLKPRKKRKSAGVSPLETEALLYIAQKRPTSSDLVQWLGVSLATVNRLLATLRDQGYEVVPVRELGQWRYEVRISRTESEILDDPLLRSAGRVKKWRSLAHETEDKLLYLED